MARPLTELTDEDIERYEEKIEIAELSGNKELLKNAKKHFLIAIKRRGLSICDFTNYPIYQYFADRYSKKKTDPGRLLKKRIDMREKRKRDFIIKRAREDYGKRYAESVREYLIKKRRYIKTAEIIDEDAYAKDIRKKDFAKYYEYIGLGKFDAVSIEKTIAGYVAEYGKRIRQESESEKQKRLYVVRRINEESGDDLTDMVNKFYDNTLSSYEIDYIIDGIIDAEIEYRERAERIKQKEAENAESGKPKRKPKKSETKNK